MRILKTVLGVPLAVFVAFTLLVSTAAAQGLLRMTYLAPAGGLGPGLQVGTEVYYETELTDERITHLSQALDDYNQAFSGTGYRATQDSADYTSIQAADRWLREVDLRTLQPDLIPDFEPLLELAHGYRLDYAELLGVVEGRDLASRIVADGRVTDVGTLESTLSTAESLRGDARLVQYIAAHWVGREGALGGTTKVKLGGPTLAVRGGPRVDGGRLGTVSVPLGATAYAFKQTTVDGYQIALVFYPGEGVDGSGQFVGWVKIISEHAALETPPPSFGRG